MYYKDDNEKPFDNNGFTFTDFLMGYGFDQLSWDTLPEEEKEQYRSEYDEMVSGAKETIDSEGGLYEAVKLNRARKRFQQINEYILNMNGENNEADEQQSQTDDMQQPQQGGAPQQDMGQQGQMSPQQEQPMDNQQMSQDGGMEQGGDMGQMGDTQPDPTIGADADNQPMPDENGMMEPEMDGEMESDEVIDVDDLTQSQETTEYKLDGVDDKLNQLINIVGKFAQAIDDNEEKMEELKRELEERNPSQQERLNIRSMSGSPYTVSPQDYWSNQNARNPQYNVIADNDVVPNEEEELYTITDDDIKNFNKSEIEKSINDIPKNLKDYFNESYRSVPDWRNTDKSFQRVAKYNQKWLERSEKAMEKNYMRMINDKSIEDLTTIIQDSIGFEGLVKSIQERMNYYKFKDVVLKMCRDSGIPVYKNQYLHNLGRINSSPKYESTEILIEKLKEYFGNEVFLQKLYSSIKPRVLKKILVAIVLELDRNLNESYTYGEEDEFMKWDSDLIYELSDYIEAQEVTGDKMIDTNFGDIEYRIGDNGETLYVTLQSEEDANDFVDVLDGSVGVYTFYRYDDQPNVVRMKIEQ